MATMNIDMGMPTLPNVVSGSTLGGDLGGLYDLITGIQGKPQTAYQTAAGMADPFAAQRGQYQQQLLGLLTDPSSFKSDPGYKFALQQGQEGITRAENALAGTMRSGALAPELAKFTEGYASQAYNDRISQLALLSGATTGSPAAAGQLYAGGYNANQSSIGGGIKTIGDLIGGLLGIGGSSGGGLVDAINKLIGGQGSALTDPTAGLTGGGETGGFPDLSNWDPSSGADPFAGLGTDFSSSGIDFGSLGTDFLTPGV